MTHYYKTHEPDINRRSKSPGLRAWLLMLVFAAAFLTGNSYAQSLANYTFQATSGTYTPLTGGTTVPAIQADDATSAAIPLGFTFNYMGVPYTQVYANSNGYITFTGTPTTSGTNMRSNNFTSTVVDHPILAPMWDDLMGNNSTGTPKASYLTTGTAGSQVFTMEWLNWAPYSLTAQTPNLSFQVILDEATGSITFHYRSDAGTTAFSGASIGVSNSPTQFVSLDGPTASPVVSYSTSTNNITSKPATDQIYRWTPVSTVTPASAGGPLTFTNIGAGALTLNWTDNSSTESHFQVYISTDDVTYTLSGQVVSTSVAGTGSAYNYTQIGLTPNTLYYFRVVAANEASLPSAPLSGSQMTGSPSFCGVRVVGPSAGADHATIADALNFFYANGLTCGSVIELQPAYSGSVETFPIVVTAFPGSTTTNTLTIRPQTGATGLSLVSSASSAFILDGVDNLIIDGRPDGTGTSRELSIQNTSTTGNAFTFINGASDNTLKFLNINGVTTSTTSGVVLFGTSTAATGNLGNTISDNRIYDGATTPTHLIYSAGTATKENSNNTISNNELYNYFNPTSTSTAVNLQANNSAWTITGNHIYQTSPRTATSGATHSVILINSSVGTSFTISNNFIGGSMINAGGASWSMPGTVATRFMGINVTSASTTGTSTIDGNTIGNLSIVSSSATTTPPAIFSGISVASGNWNVGTVTPNTIGSLTNTGNIVVTATTTGTSIFGISSTSSGNITIANNNIGSFELINAASNSVRMNFTGINANSGTVIITGNTIGGAVGNSINNQSGNTATTSGHATTGIGFSGTTGTITDNTIQNLSYSAGGSRAVVIGINISSGTVTADNNTIFRLTNSSANTLTGSSTSIIGLSMTSTSAGTIISDTDIDGLFNSAATAAVNATGIYYSGSSTGSNIISRNQVRGIRLSTTSATSVITGIQVAGGASTYRNNIVNLGLDDSGSPVTGSYVINGILKATTASNNFFYNTIRIQGSGVGTGTSNTYAFIRTSTGNDELRNNIISNTRTNATTGGNHIGISLNTGTTFLALKNNYWVTGPVFGVLTSNYASFGDWQTGTGLDATSMSVDPNFVSSTDSHLSTTVPSPLESAATAITGITNDYDNDVRPGPAGSTNGGGTAPDIGADEFDGIPVPMDIAAFALVSPATTGCYTSNETVTIQIKNNSSSVIDFTTSPATVSASVTGPNPVTFTPVVISTGTIAAGATQNVVMSTTYDMSAAGVYVFNGDVALTGDGNTANNTLPAVTINVTPGTASASSTNLCGGQSTTLTLTGNNGTIQWQGSTDGTTWVNETGTGNTASPYTVTPADTMYYRALVCGNLTSNVVTINATFVTAPATSNVTRCGAGMVTLNATSNDSIYWYSSATSTTPIGSGPSYSATVSANTTYYVSATNFASSYSVGLATNAAGGAQQTTTNYNIFSVFTPAFLSGVYVYPGAAGNAVLELRNSAGTVLNTATLAVTSTDVNQKTWFPLNWNLPVATDLRLGRAASSVSLFRSDVGVTYPYTIPGVLSITGSAAGNTYYYFAYDWQVKVGCESPRVAVDVTVTPATPITVSASNSTICNGESTTLSVSSANTGYTYSWSPSTGLSATTGASVTATPTSSMTYTVTASDAAGCEIIGTVGITVNPSPIIAATATPAAICPGGSSQLEVVNTTPQFYTIGTGTIVNSNTSYPAPYGNYYWGARHQFIIRASELSASGLTAGNIESLAFDVTNTNGTDPLSGFEVKMGMTAATTASAFETGLTTVYTNASYAPTTGWNVHTFSTPFVWDGVSNLVIETCFNNASYTYNASMNQSATSYPSLIYYRSDASGVCSNTTVSGTENQRPNVRLGRAITFTYDWSPAGSLSATTITNPVATPAATTTYTVSVTSSNGCISTATTEVMVNTITASVTSTDVSCNGGSDGSATVAAVGGTTITYVWNTVPAQTTPTASNLVAGTYTVIVTNETGCTDTAVAVITEPTPLTVTVNTTNVTCQGGNDGSATAVVNGGTPGYTYSWVTGGVLATENNLSAGTYTLNITDANGCTVNETVTILDGAIVTVNITGNDTICTGSSTTLTATGATAYSWSTGETTATITATPTTTTTYTVTGADVNGCVGSAMVEVVTETAPNAAFTYSTVTGMDFDFVGSGANTLTWDFGDMTNGTGANVSHSYTAAGSYNVVLTASNSCGSDTSLQVIVVSGVTAQNASKVLVYPNPSKGMFNVEMSGTDVSRITVLDVEGRVVVDKTVSSASVIKSTIDLSAHAKGVYTLRVIGSTTQNFRLILN